MFQEDPGFITIGFYERIDQLKRYYQALIRDDTDPKAFSAAMTGIKDLRRNVGEIKLKESEGPDLELRRDMLVGTMRDVLNAYIIANKDSELDFCGSELEDYVRWE